ncbi:MAG: type II toxin-antitoxin system VapC family toxin [Blastocatellia bacterium]
MFVLDSDHVSLLQRATSPEAQRLRFRFSGVKVEDRFVTIITFEEQLRGWLAQIARAKSPLQEIEPYRRLEALLKYYSAINLLGFDERAAEKFQELKKARIRIGTMDLKIAAIALAHNATLLSGNLRDFSRVPDLKVEDWSV